MNAGEVASWLTISRSRTESESRVGHAQMLFAHREKPSFFAVGMRRRSRPWKTSGNTCARRISPTACSETTPQSSTLASSHGVAFSTSSVASSPSLTVIGLLSVNHSEVWYKWIRRTRCLRVQFAIIPDLSRSDAVGWIPAPRRRSQAPGCGWAELPGSIPIRHQVPCRGPPAERLPSAGR
jgi:hypothetical protein